MTELLLVAAVENEIALLTRELKTRMMMEVGGVPVYHSWSGKTHVLVATTGIGVVSTAATLGALLQRLSHDCVLMIGSAGSFPQSPLALGDLVLASSEIMAELGLSTGIGVADTQALGLPGLCQELELDSDMTTQLAMVLDLVPRSIGRFLTVAGVSADLHQARKRAQRFGVLVENMEGYALALVGRQFRIPVSELRAVSNIAGDRDKSRWMLRQANEKVQLAALAYIGRIS